MPKQLSQWRERGVWGKNLLAYSWTAMIKSTQELDTGITVHDPTIAGASVQYNCQSSRQFPQRSSPTRYNLIAPKLHRFTFGCQHGGVPAAFMIQKVTKMPSDSSMSSDLGMSKLLPVLIRAHSNLSHRTASYSNYSQFFANRLQFNLQSLLLVHADYGFATSECDLSHLSSRSAYNICPVPSLEVLTSDQSWQGCKFICDFLCKTLPLFKTKTNQKISNFDRLSALACKYIRRLGTTVRLCCCEKCVWTKACALGCLHSHSCRFVMLCYPQKSIHL